MQYMKKNNLLFPLHSFEGAVLFERSLAEKQISV